MRRSLWILPALLLSAIRTSNAPVDVIATYGISFDGDNAPAVVGSKLISYDTGAGCFTSPASIVLSYRGTDYTLPLADPKNQKPTDPARDSYVWGTGVRPNGLAEIFVIDLTTSRNIYIYYANPGDTIPGGAGPVALIAGGESRQPSPTIEIPPGGPIHAQPRR
jgi:hypothetical protein